MSNEALAMTPSVKMGIALNRSYSATVRLEALMIVNEIIDLII